MLAALDGAEELLLAGLGGFCIGALAGFALGAIHGLVSSWNRRVVDLGWVVAGVVMVLVVVWMWFSAGEGVRELMASGR
jgi:hypothetical protein